MGKAYPDHHPEVFRAPPGRTLRNKDVCMKCWKSNWKYWDRFPLSEKASRCDYYAKTVCPIGLGKNKDYTVCVNGLAPKNCPYLLEHICANEMDAKKLDSHLKSKKAKRKKMPTGGCVKHSTMQSKKRK